MLCVSRDAEMHGARSDRGHSLALSTGYSSRVSGDGPDMEEWTLRVVRWKTGAAWVRA
mgnify:CR=1 FL=1